jgi:myb proto-oncogene protein
MSIKKRNWNSEEDKLLQKLVEKYGNRWNVISNEMKNRSGKQIRDRYINILISNTSKFTIDEDILLLDLHKIYGNRWSEISKFFINRSSDRIKSRYHSSIRNKEKLLYFFKSLSNSNTTKKLNNLLL